MKYEEMKTKFKGVYIKKPRAGEENSIGYHNDNATQLLYKSEIIKYSRIGCAINGSLYVVPTELMKQLKAHVENNSSTLPIEVTYKEERYIIPASSLQLFGSDSTPEPKVDNTYSYETATGVQTIYADPLKEFAVPTNTKYFDDNVITEIILTKAQQVIEDCKVMSSLPFYKTLFIQENLLVTSIENQVTNLTHNVTEEKVINAIVSLVILNEIHKD